MLSARIYSIEHSRAHPTSKILQTPSPFLSSHRLLSSINIRFICSNKSSKCFPFLSDIDIWPSIACFDRGCVGIKELCIFIMKNYISNEQDQSSRFFVIDSIHESIQPKLVPIAQLLNLQTIDISELRGLMAHGVPEESGRIREYAWKLVLGFLPKDRKRWQSHLQHQQSLYSSFLEEFLNSQKYSAAPLVLTKDDIRWSLYESDYHLWDSIEKDTSRTQAQLSFFSSQAPEITVPFFTSTRREKFKLISGNEQLSHLSRAQQNTTYNYDFMTRILFIFARLNPKVAYVQGMNEVLAPIFYLLNANRDPTIPIQEATCFFMFNNVMSDILEMLMRDFSKQENPVHGRMRHINTMLLALQPKTWQKLDQLKIDPFFYCFRWITLLFSQEFEMFQTLRIWESIFSYEDRKTYTNYLALSIILLSAEFIENNQYGQIMKYLRAINQNIGVEEVIEKANDLYKKYGKTDLADLAQKNLKRLNETKHKSIFTFFRKIF